MKSIVHSGYTWDQLEFFTWIIQKYTFTCIYIHIQIQIHVFYFHAYIHAYIIPKISCFSLHIIAKSPKIVLGDSLLFRSSFAPPVSWPQGGLTAEQCHQGLPAEQCHRDGCFFGVHGAQVEKWMLHQNGSSVHQTNHRNLISTYPQSYPYQGVARPTIRPYRDKNGWSIWPGLLSKVMWNFIHLKMNNQPVAYLGVSKNRGIPKWMVYNGKTY